jgi:membrane protease YdiL (CAAX protease family)
MYMLLKGEFAKDRFWIKCLLVLFLSVLGFLLWLSFTKIIQADPSNIRSLQLSQFAFAIFGLVLPALAIGYLLDKKPVNYLHLNTFSKGILIIFPILIMVGIQPCINLFVAWNEQLHLPEALGTVEAIFRKMQQMNEALTLRLLSGKTYTDLFTNLFFLALVPAVCEELFFRGAVQQVLGEKMGKHAAIWITAILFSAYHVDLFGFFPRIVLGAVLGYLVLYSNSLYMSMIGHFTNNALVVIYLFVSSTSFISVDINQIGTGEQWWISAISVLVTAILLYTFYKRSLYSKKENTL